MNPKVLIPTFAGIVCLLSLLSPAAAECDDCLVKCFACDPKVHDGQCETFRDQVSKDVTEGCISHKGEFMNPVAGAGYLPIEKVLAPGVRYLGYAWATYCGFFCGMCSDDEPTRRCQSKYGEKLANGDLVLGGCKSIDLYGYKGGESCALDTADKNDAVAVAYYRKMLPWIDDNPSSSLGRPSAKSFEDSDSAYGGPRHHNRGERKRFRPAYVPMEREEAKSSRPRW